MNRYEKALTDIRTHCSYNWKSGNRDEWDMRTSVANTTSYKVISELVDKSVPKALLEVDQYWFGPKFGKCVCGSSVDLNRHSNYCGKCGQKLDWGL